MESTPIAEVPLIVASVRDAFNTHQTKDISWRKSTLRQLYSWIEKNEKTIVDALDKDLHRTDKTFSYITEIVTIFNEISHALRHIDEWVEPEKPKDVPMVVADSKAEIRHEPYGVVLIVGTWNLPFTILLNPLVSAIAAGCAVVLKPSEVAPTVCALMSDLVKALHSPFIACVCGGVEETTVLLKERFDMIHYTGNGAVAKIIMAAAAKNLTPVVLELGGKSPVYVHKECNLVNAARRIMWGKMVNFGQACISPDYVLVHRDVREKFMDEIKAAVADFYGEDPQKHSALNRIVNAGHFSRIEDILNRQMSASRSKVVVGGQTDAKDLYIAPTVISDVSATDPVMLEEIFGPVLPVLDVDDEDDAIRIINNRDNALALYIFTTNNHVAEKMISKTKSGAVVINDVIVHNIVEELPFGGVGASGMGESHGSSGFRAFSHRRSTLWRPMGMEAGNAVRYPNADPKLVRWMVDSIVKKTPPSDFWLSVYKGLPSSVTIGYFLAAVIGFGVGWKAARRS